MNSREKGKRGERLWRDQLKLAGYPNSRRGQQFSGDESAPDVICEDLRSLTAVTEVRGCSQKRMGQAMIGCGIQSLKEGCDDSEEALRLARQMLEAWTDLIESEDIAE